MILLLLQSQQSAECKQQLERRTEEPVMLCNTVRDAIAALRQDSYSAVVLDQNLFDLDSPHAEALVRHLGSAAPVFVNPGICGVERVCRETELALERARREKQLASQAAKQELREQLSGAVTTILLSSELALKAEALPPVVEEKLRSVHEVALQISDCLR
jgi:hypothetical protein